MNGQTLSVPPITRYRRGLTCALLGLSLGTSTWANQALTDPLDSAAQPVPPPAASKPAPGAQPPRRVDLVASLQALGRYLTPADMAELTRFMFQVVTDFFKGTQEASLPPDLLFKLAVLEQRFKREGDLYMQQVLRDLDRDIRRFLSENLPNLALPALPENKAKNGP